MGICNTMTDSWAVDTIISRYSTVQYQEQKEQKGQKEKNADVPNGGWRVTKVNSAKGKT